MSQKQIDCLFYSANQVFSMVGIQKTKGYTWLEQIRQAGEPFKVIRIDKLYKIPRKSFDSWIETLA